MITHWKWDQVFKNGPSKICGRQPLKNFTWSIFEYFFLNESDKLIDLSLISCFSWQLQGKLRAAINASLTRYLSVFPILMIQRQISFLHFCLFQLLLLECRLLLTCSLYQSLRRYESALLLTIEITNDILKLFWN